MRTGDYPAFAVHPGAGEQGVRRGRIHLGKQQGGRPAAHGMAGRVTAFAAERGFLPREHGLMEHLERTATVIEGLRGHAHLVRRGETAGHDPPDGRGRCFRNGQTERSGELGKQGFVTPDGIPFGDVRPDGVLTLGLPPLIAHDVIGKPVGKGIRRGRHALDQVGKLLRRVVFLLRRSCEGDKEQEKDGEGTFQSCHRWYPLFGRIVQRYAFLLIFVETHTD